MKIEMGKKYRTKNRRYAIEILVTDLSNPKYPVVAKLTNLATGEKTATGFTAEGVYCYGNPSDADLVEVGPYDDFKIDEPVMSRDCGTGSWRRRYFAGVTSDGQPMTFVDGKTKWSAETREKMVRYEIRRPTREELES